jgi:hypothetical protein
MPRRYRGPPPIQEFTPAELEVHRQHYLQEYARAQAADAIRVAQGRRSRLPPPLPVTAFITSSRHEEPINFEMQMEPSEDPC